MRVCCIICGDLFLQDSVISAIICGHVFHNHCLLQWLESSKSCPQCRSKVTSKNICRLFLEANIEPITEDAAELKNKNDSLSVAIIEKDQIILALREENGDLKEKTKGLRKECRRLEKLINERDIKISAFAEQQKHMNTLVLQVSKAEDEVFQAKSQLRLYRHIDDILRENKDDIEDIISANGSNSEENVRSLSTVTSFMKSHISKLKEDKQKMSEDIRCLSHGLELAKKDLLKLQSKLAASESNTLSLTDDIESLKKENKCLNKVIKVLQEVIQPPTDDLRTSALQKCLTESTPTQLLRIVPSEFTSSAEVCNASKSSLPTKEDTKSPYSQAVAADVLRQPLAAKPLNSLKFANRFLAHKKNSNITFDVPGRDVGYDGLGGHHQVDSFPQPIKHSLKRRRKQEYSAVNSETKKLSTHFTATNAISKQSTVILKDFFTSTFDD